MATETKRVFLHIGPPKTGTTYLQSVLRTNQRRLRAAGVLVPGKGLGPAPHFEAVGDLRGRARRAGRRVASGAWEKLSAEVRQWSGASSVISCEWMAFCDDTQIDRALRSFGDAEVHVVATVRDLGRVVPAVWQEQIKNGKHFTMVEFLERLAQQDSDAYGQWFWRVHDTRELLGRWTPAVPADRVHVVTLPRSGAAPDELWHRFSSLFAADPDAFDTSEVRANPGLDPAEAELLRRVNAELGGRMRKAAHGPLVKQYLHEELTRQEGAGGRVRLPVEALASIAARAEQVVEGLRVGGYDLVGSLDDLTVDTTVGTTQLPEDSDTADVAQAAVTSMAALLLTMQADGAHRRKAWRSQPGSGGANKGGSKDGAKGGGAAGTGGGTAGKGGKGGTVGKGRRAGTGDGPGAVRTGRRAAGLALRAARKMRRAAARG